MVYNDVTCCCTNLHSLLELNFQVLALVPAVLVTVGALQFVTRFIFKQVPKRAVYTQVRSELRVVERLLNLRYVHMDTQGVME